MKLDKKILLFFIIILTTFSSCTNKNKIRLIGFAFKGDNIMLHTELNRYSKITVKCKEGRDKICLFNESIKWNEEAHDIRLTVQVDSFNVTLLDTTVTIPKHYKEPFISFVQPSLETNFNRRIFIGDEGESRFLKE